MRARRSGFTLLELMIVIVIVSILSSILLWGVLASIVAAKETNSQAMVRALAGALESYKSQYGDYPPSSLEYFNVKLPNETNNGIEALVACMSTTKSGGPFYRPADEGQYTNVDNDKAPKNVTQWFFGDLELRELSDNFGNCLWYVHAVDYDKPKKAHLSVLPRRGGEKLEVKIYKSDKTKTFSNPGRFQLVSAGRDEKYGTNDDIKAW